MRLVMWLFMLIVVIASITGRLEKNLYDYFMATTIMIVFMLEELFRRTKRKSLSELRKEMDDFINMLERKQKIKNIINLKKKEKDDGKN